MTLSDDSGDPLTKFIDTFSFDVADATSMADGDHDFFLRELLFRLLSKDRYDLCAAKNAVKAAPRETLWAAMDLRWSQSDEPSALGDRQLPEGFQATTSGTSGPNELVVSVSGGGRVYDGASRDLTVSDLLRVQQSVNDAISQAIAHLVAEPETVAK